MGFVLVILFLNVEDFIYSIVNMNLVNKFMDVGYKFLFNEVGLVELIELVRCGIVVIVICLVIFVVIVNFLEFFYLLVRICEYCYCICGL